MTTDTRDPAAIALIESGVTWRADEGNWDVYIENFKPMAEELMPAYPAACSRISACAPELARWFLKTEFPCDSGEWQGAYDCMACGRPNRHADDCEWLALAKKLGVR